MWCGRILNPHKTKGANLLNLCAPNPCLRRQRLSTGDIKVRRQGPVTCLGLNRTHKKNCITPRLADLLLQEIEIFEKDDQSSVAVIYGEKGNFSYGLNSEDVENCPDIHEAIVQTGLLDKYPLKPIVAAISGYSTGIAFDIALWCDFRIVEETSILAAYARNAGIPANKRLVFRLENCVGSARALDWLLTGRAVKAKEAFDAGAASRIVACGTGVGQAVNFAHSLANMPQASLRADRALIYSTSEKFYSKDIILRELEHYTYLAKQEVERGAHLTSTGDVRHKKWS